MSKRHQTTLLVGEMLSGKSYWASTHLEELRTKWFGVERVTVWDGLQSKGLGDLAALNGNDLIIFDHIVTDDQWQEFFEVLPALAERSVAIMIITQPDIGDIARMEKLFALSDWWVFFHHDKATSEMYNDESLRAVCALKRSFTDSLPELAIGEYRSVRGDYRTQHSRR